MVISVTVTVNLNHSGNQMIKTLYAALPFATRKNTVKSVKIAFKVKGQGQMSPKSKHMYGSPYYIFLSSYINFALLVVQLLCRLHGDKRYLLCHFAAFK